MSSITGSCSQTESQQLFEQGIQQVQEVRQLQRSQQLQAENKQEGGTQILNGSDSGQSEKTINLAEPLKGLTIDDYA